MKAHIGELALGVNAHHIQDPPFGFGKVERYNTSSVRGVVFPNTETRQFPLLPYVTVFTLPYYIGTAVTVEVLFQL